MPRAEIALPSGAKITIEGSEAEVRDLVDHYAHSRRATKEDGVVMARETPVRPRSEGPTGYVRQIKSAGFFESKRGLGAVQERLAELGHIYPQTTLSAILVKLTRNKELRRMKEKGVWVYVNP